MYKTSAIKLEISWFDKKSNFFLWQVRMKDILIWQGLIVAFICEKRLAIMEDKT